MRRDTASFRGIAFGTMGLTLVSALLTAMFDAATIEARLNHETIQARPLGLHTFSIAVITAVVAAGAILLPRIAFTKPARATYGIVAALNLTVPVLQRRHPEFGLLIPSLHVAAAVLLLGLVLVSRSHQSPTGARM
jgi:energy-converting hydrogenase Eha subunit A